MDDPRSRARPLAPSSSGAGVPFGRYVLLDRLARGGMGEVFRALAVGARGFEKPVVVKRILPQLASWQRLSAMFAEEAKLMSRLVHPNIVQVIDFGEGEQDDYFLVMELVDGVDLRRFCQAYAEQDARVPVPLALYIAASVLRGLSHAHRRAYGDGRTLVHRDVSPGNVLLSGVGEVKVADFGVALVARPGAEAESGALLVGKPSYMAPEQYRGAPLDARADIFSAGVILYEMLSGALPFAGEDAAACQAAALAGRRRAASALRPELGPDIDALLDIALSAEREKRFAEARAMARAIEALRGRGQKIAGPDELAEAVDAIRRCGADRRPSLVAAGSGADEGGAPVPEPPRHLTRLGEGDDLGQFTLRISHPEIDASVVRELEPGLPPREDEPAPPQRAPGRRGRAAAAVAGALVAALAALGAVWLLARGPQAPPRPVPAAGSVAPAAAGAPRPPPTAQASAPAEPAGSVTAGPSMPAGSARAAAGAWATVASARPHASAAPSASAPGSAATAAVEPPACSGEIHLYAAHGWVVSGGPSPVQAPGRYRWPCGRYSLTAISRVDPADRRSAQATVRDGASAVVDLR